MNYVQYYTTLIKLKNKIVQFYRYRATAPPSSVTIADSDFSFESSCNKETKENYVTRESDGLQ